MDTEEENVAYLLQVEHVLHNLLGSPLENVDGDNSQSFEGFQLHVINPAKVIGKWE